jgi:hypothetical protein
VGRTIRGFVSLASAKIRSVLGLVESTLWNLFGLDLGVVVRSLGIPSRLGGLEKKLLQEVDMWLMAPKRTRTAPVYEVDHWHVRPKTRKSRNRNRIRFVELCKAVLIREVLTFNLSHP